MLLELYCSDIGRSIAFYATLGFTVAYERPKERFVFLERWSRSWR